MAAKSKWAPKVPPKLDERAYAPLFVTPHIRHRFAEKLKEGPPVPTGKHRCLIWTGAKTHGRPIMRIQDFFVPARRISYALHHTPDREFAVWPKGDCTPTCKTPDCVQPMHILFGSHTKKHKTQRIITRRAITEPSEILNMFEPSPERLINTIDKSLIFSVQKPAQTEKSEPMDILELADKEEK